MVPQHCAAHPHQNLDTRTGTFIASAVNTRQGPHLNCLSNGQGQNGQRVDFHCWSPGEGGTWSYIVNLNTGVSGWVRDDFLSGFGSNRRCNGT